MVGVEEDREQSSQRLATAELRIHCAGPVGRKRVSGEIQERETREEVSKKKIVVPEGMLKSADAHIRRKFDGVRCIHRIELVSESIEAALRWLSENPIVPKFDQEVAILKDCEPLNEPASISSIAMAWQRRMFLAPEPEIPDEIEDLLPFPPDVVIPGNYLYRQVKAHLDNVATEAFRRGQKAGPQ